MNNKDWQQFKAESEEIGNFFVIGLVIGLIIRVIS